MSIRTSSRLRAAILDEPTAGLSPLYAERVWEQIDRIRGTGVALLVVEQNASLAMRHADSVCLLAQGRNVLSGSASELRTTPKWRGSSSDERQRNGRCR